MNKTVKIILIGINILMIIFSLGWLVETFDYEPMITLGGQFISLVGLIFESKINKIITNKNKRSVIDIETSGNHSITANKNENSEVKIKSRD